MGSMVYIDGIRAGNGARSKWTYAKLFDACTHELKIAATLDYITEAVNTRGLTLVTKPA